MKRLLGLAMTILLLLVPVTCSAMTVDELDKAIMDCQQNQKAAHEMAECARWLGYSENSVIIQEAQARWWIEQDKKNEYRSEKARIGAKSREYPVAWEVWNRLHNAGYNDAVSAGILGNMMAEAGGQTLALSPTLYSNGYYGLCQWSLYYNPDVSGRDIQGQIEYLQSTIRTNMDYFGGSGTYDKFLTLQDEKEAARYFNNYYERGTGTSVRQSNATIAYYYFTE